MILLSVSWSGAADHEFVAQWDHYTGLTEDKWPEPGELAKTFPVKNKAFRQFLVDRLDQGLGIDDGNAAGRILETQPVNGMLFIDMEFAGRQPAGKVLLMKAMQNLPYLECYQLLLKATDDHRAVKWNIPPDRKGSQPLPPGSLPMRVCDHAFRSLRWRLRDWQPMVDTLGRRSLTSGTKIEDRNKLIETMKDVWKRKGNELLLPSYRMAQTGSADRGLNKAEITKLRETVFQAEIVTGTLEDIDFSGSPRNYLVIPEPLITANRKDPITVLLELRSILANEKPEIAHKAYSVATGLFFSPEQGSKNAAETIEAYDQPVVPGGKSRRQSCIGHLEDIIFAVAGNRLAPGYQLDYLGYYTPGIEFKRFALKHLPEEHQSDLYGFATNLIQRNAMPFAYNPNLYELLPKPRDEDAHIRVSAAENKGEKDLIELSWRAFDQEIKWVLGQNIACLVIPTAKFDTPAELSAFLNKVYLMEDKPNWFQPYKVQLPWPEALRDGIEISSDIEKHPALDVYAWPIRVDLVVRNGAAHVLTYHRNMQVPGFEPGDAWFSDKFVRAIAKK